MSQPASVCPGCSFGELSAPLILPNQPAILNYRFPTPAAASSVARMDVCLRQCRKCGLVFNAQFRSDLVPYDANYDNTQSCSPTFLRHLESVADMLIERYELREKSILEVGCGKGAFLELLCERGNNEGAGYDTTYEGPASKGRVRYFVQYVSAADIDRKYAAIICRHVVEHVPAIGDFFKELAAIARAAGDPVVVVETPSFEWIVEHGTFWDLFNEHCNYFSLPTLSYLAQLAGFENIGQRTVFDGQYQLLELRLAQTRPEVTPPGIPQNVDLEQFAVEVERSKAAFESKLLSAGADKGWAIWGAGAKGVALITQLGIRKPDFVIDVNPGKQGCVIPGSTIPVVSPEAPEVAKCPLILVANPNYLEEIRATLKSLGFSGTLIAA